MTGPANAERADRALVALRAYVTAAGEEFTAAGVDDHLTDLLADLCHLAHRDATTTPEALLKRGYGHYEDEAATCPECGRVVDDLSHEQAGRRVCEGCCEACRPR